MKNVLPALFLLLFRLCSLSADSSLQVRAGAFLPTSDLFRDIYGDAEVCYGIEASTSIMGCFDGWVNFDWFHAHGKSTVKKSSTKIEIANMSFGVKLPYLISDNFAPYLGIGPSLSRVWIKNTTDCFSTDEKWAIGGVVKMGIHYYFCDCMLLDLFADYLFQPVYFHKRTDVGGFKTGAGLGIIF